MVRVRPHLWRWIAASIDGGRVLEIGPGLRPTAPLEGSYFVDRSVHALGELALRGGSVAAAGRQLPFPTGYFAAVLAFEVLEHVERDDDLLAEIARVLRPGGLLVMSAPIRMSHWSPLDDACGHVRRYEPEDLFDKLRANGLGIEGYEPASYTSPCFRRAQGRILRANRQVTIALLQSLFYPLHAATQRVFGSVRWTPPDASVPAGAVSITAYARRRDHGVGAS